MGTYNFVHGAIFGRRFLSILFGQKNKRPDKECWNLEAFIRGIVIGSGWEFKELKDWFDFSKFYLGGASTPPIFLNTMLSLWHDIYLKDGGWVVLDKLCHNTVWAYFKNGIRVSNWIEL